MTLPEHGDLDWDAPVNDAIQQAQSDAAAAKADASSARSTALSALEAAQSVGDIASALSEAQTAASDAAGSASDASGAATTAGAAANSATSARDAAIAAKQAAEAVGSTNDTIIAGRINTPGSATATALTASFAAKPRTGTKAVGQGELFVNVLDYGAVGDGIADDTTPLTDAAAAALASGRTLYIPRGVILRITANVNLVGIDVDARGTIKIDYLGGPGLTAGDSSANRITRVLRFDRVEHAAGTGQSVPALRLVGLKDGQVTVNFCHYLQLYADAASSTTDSIAYSSFWLGDINKLELYGAAGTSWINENTFYGGRFSSILIGAVTYHHNGNRFFHPKVESGSITLNTGASNKFYDVRGEGGGTITFATGTHHNDVLCSWASTASVSTSPFTVTDSGLRNRVIPLELRTARVAEIASIDASTRMYNGGASEIVQVQQLPGPSLTAALTLVPGSAKILSDNNACHMDSGLIPLSILGGDFPARLGRLQLVSDAAVWRPRIAFYDANGAWLNPGASDPGYMSTSGGWTWNAGGYYTFGSDSTGGRISLNGVAGVAYVRVMVIGSTTNALFSFVRLEALVGDDSSDAIIQRVQRQMRRTPALASAPTQGYANVGDQVAKTAGGVWTCTARNYSTLTSAKTAGDTVMSLASGTGFTAGDVIGVLLDSGATHWTTVASVATNDVTLTAALPAGSNAAIGNRADAMRWA